MPYLLESVRLVEEGVPGQLIDKAAVDFGMPMGPIELADTIGLDICFLGANILTEHLGGEVPERLKQMVEQGHLGRKTGRGFYRYDKKGKKMPSNVVDTSGATRLTGEEMTDRLIFRMLNEAKACLREGVVEDADLLDAGMIFGTGFAPFRGGPMHYADSRGAKAIKSTLSALAKDYGERFKADEAW